VTRTRTSGASTAESSTTMRPPRRRSDLARAARTVRPSASVTTGGPSVRSGRAPPVSTFTEKGLLRTSTAACAAAVVVATASPARTATDPQSRQRDKAPA
jgi:hypothetical protein